MHTLFGKIRLLAERPHRAVDVASIILWFVVLSLQAGAVIRTGTTANAVFMAILVTLGMVTHLRIRALKRAHERGIRSTMNLLYDTGYMDEIAGMPGTGVVIEELRRLKSVASSSATASVAVAVWLANLDEVRNEHGDLVGSTAVMDLAKTLQRIARGEDLVAYVGGGRFAIVLADCSLEQSDQFSLRIPARLIATVAGESHALGVAAQCYDVGSTELDDLVAGVNGGSCLIEPRPGRQRGAGTQLDAA